VLLTILAIAEQKRFNLKVSLPTLQRANLLHRVGQSRIDVDFGRQLEVLCLVKSSKLDESDTLNQTTVC
jgi:hypothetical protein